MTPHLKQASERTEKSTDKIYKEKKLIPNIKKKKIQFIANTYIFSANAIFKEWSFWGCLPPCFWIMLLPKSVPSPRLNTEFSNSLNRTNEIVWIELKSSLCILFWIMLVRKFTKIKKKKKEVCIIFHFCWHFCVSQSLKTPNLKGFSDY